MKKVFFLLLVVVGSITARAQFGTPYLFPLVAGDTLNNVDSVFKMIQCSGGYSDIGIQVGILHISGTQAGKVILYGSMDGITWQPTDSATYSVPLTSSYSTPTYSGVASFTKTGAPFYQYLVVATSSGTVSQQVRVRYTLRRRLVTQVY